MTGKKKLSQDGMIKNLIRDYPVDALDFFNPEIIKLYGKPVRVDFPVQEVKKHSHYDKNLVNDLTIIYEFKKGKKLVLVLVEHWSHKSKFDIHRFAHYLIDLEYRYPGYEKLPVALFTDESKKWEKTIQREIIIKCLDVIYMIFRFRLIRMKDHEAKRYRNTKNRFVAVLRSAMLWEIADKILLAAELIKSYTVLEKDIRNVIKNIDIIEYFFHIDGREKDEITELLRGAKETNMSIVQEFIKEGEIKGKIEGKLETARKMYDKGFSIEDIIDITELSEEDLKKAGISSNN